MTEMYKATLKERYEHKRNNLFEATILKEFNADQMKQAVQIFKALQSINFSQANMKVFAAARDSAINDVDAVLSNKSQQGLIKRFANLFRKKDQNPLIDAFAFCDALKNFFDGMLQYVEARKTNVDTAEDKTLQQLIAGDPDDKSVEALTANREKLQNLQDLIINGFKPTGQIKKIAKNWQKKYVKNNFKGIAKDLMGSKVKDIESVAKAVVDNLANVATIAQSLMGAQNTVSGSKPTTTSTGTEQSGVSQPTGSSTPASQSDNAAGDMGRTSNAKAVAIKTANEIYSSMEEKFGNLDQATVKKIIAVLAYDDMIKI